MKLTFLESEMDAESIALLIDHFETCHVLTIITRVYKKLLNNERSPVADLQEF